MAGSIGLRSGGEGRSATRGTSESWPVRAALTLTALAFLVFFLGLPLGAVFTEALRNGVGAYLDALRDPDAWAAIRLTLLTAAIAVPLAYTGRRFARLNRGLRVASGLLSLGFGLFLTYRVGIVDGLFTGRVLWAPH